MPGSTAFGFPYPVLGDQVRPPTDFKALADALQDFLNAPFCKLILNANFAVANNSNTVSIPFGSGSEAIKTHASMHDNTVNNTRIIAPKSGIYEAGFAPYWTGNTTGIRSHCIGINGVRQAPEGGYYTTPPSGNLQLPPAIGEFACNANDYIEAFAFQSTGSSFNLPLIGNGLSTTTTNTVFWAKWVRPLPV